MKYEITRAVRGVVAVLLIGLASSGHAGPITYTFTAVADNSDLFGAFVGPSINNEGTIAFFADLKAGGTGIFRADGGSITTIAESGGAFAFFGVGGRYINDQGSVAFLAGLFGGGGAVFAGNGTSTSTIYSVGPGGDAPRLLGGINSAGTVAFRTFNGSIFTGNGGGPAMLLPTPGLVNGSGDISLNDEGAVAFDAFRPGTNGEGLFISRGGAITTIVEPRTFVDVGNPTINDSGTVAFRAFLDPTHTSQAILVGSSGQLMLTADTSGPFSGPLFPALDSEGTVVFLAGLRSGGSGIFRGPDPVADVIIASGDPLFGSTVTNVLFTEGGLNDNGQVAFVAQLEDGREVVVRAEPVPEPSSLVLGVTGALFGLGYWWRRRVRAVA